MVISGEGTAAVCYDCILVMRQVVEDENPSPPEKFELAKPIAPREIYSDLDNYVVGQERAKKSPKRSGLQPLQTNLEWTETLRIRY